MEAGKIRLLEFIGSSKRTFNIPVYQRNYDWKYQQCKRLFCDIENIAKSNNEIEHFLGTIVYVVDRSLPTFTEFILIDGQQRITSISLLIKALYDVIKDKNLKQDILETFLINRNTKEEYRLKLKSIDSDRRSYKKIMKNEELDQKSNIIENYILFKKLIEESEYSPEKLYEALNYIHIVYIALENGKKSENPQMIFESLNSTGLSLTQADLIRNFLLMNHSYDKQNFLYHEYWLKIEKRLTNVNISNFVRDYLTLKTGKIPTKSNVYDTFKQYVKLNKTINEESALEDLLLYSKYYSWFLFCKSPNKSINNLLQQIQQIRSTVIYPTLLYIFEDCFEKSICDIKELEKTLKIFIAYLYRRIICDYPTNALNKIFASFPKDIEKLDKEIYSYKVLEVLSKKIGKSVFPRNEEFKSAFISKDLYKSNIHKYTLYQLEKYNNKEVVELNEDISIEHIMPQTLTPAWKKDLGKKYDEIQIELLHTVGNLTLTAYNGNLSNKSFRDKKEILLNSNISITRNIINYDSWNDINIRDRANKLFDIAKEVWNLPEEYNKQISNFKEISYETEYNLTDEINVTGETPKKIIILDMEYSVSSWRGVMRKICDCLYDLDSEIFTSLTKHKDFEGRTKRRISENSENMQEPYKLGENVYIDLHGSAVELINNCILIAEKFGVENDIYFMLKPKWNYINIFKIGK